MTGPLFSAQSSGNGRFPRYPLKSGLSGHADIADATSKGQFAAMDDESKANRTVSRSIFIGLGAGVAIEILAILAAFVSAGAGHGSYIAARMLFPYSMLLTLVEGMIGPLAISAGLVQFPVYGAIVGWALAAGRRKAATVLLAAHLIAAFTCFSGVLQDFS